MGGASLQTGSRLHSIQLRYTDECAATNDMVVGPRLKLTASLRTRALVFLICGLRESVRGEIEIKFWI